MTAYFLGNRFESRSFSFSRIRAISALSLGLAFYTEAATSLFIFI